MISHVVLELLQVFMLLCQLLLELQELLLLTHTDSVVLIGLLTLGKGITNKCQSLAYSSGLLQRGSTNPDATPAERGAPVSPLAMARVVVEKAARDWREERTAGRTALDRDCRYIIAESVEED